MAKKNQNKLVSRTFTITNTSDLNLLGQMAWEMTDHKTAWDSLSFSEREKVRERGEKLLQAELTRMEEARKKALGMIRQESDE